MGNNHKTGRIEELLEAIRKFIPGFSGYQEKEYIIDSDILLRHNIAIEMEKFAKVLEGIRENLFLQGKLPAEGNIESAVLRLKMMASSFRDSQYNDHTRTRMEEMPLSGIERLYEYDLSILDHIEGLNTPIEKLESLRDNPREFLVELEYLNSAIDPVEEHRIKREEFLLKTS